MPPFTIAFPHNVQYVLKIICKDALPAIIFRLTTFAYTNWVGFAFTYDIDIAVFCIDVVAQTLHLRDDTRFLGAFNDRFNWHFIITQTILKSLYSIDRRIFIYPLKTFLFVYIVPNRRSRTGRKLRRGLRVYPIGLPRRGRLK